MKDISDIVKLINICLLVVIYVLIYNFFDHFGTVECFVFTFFGCAFATCAFALIFYGILNLGRKSYFVIERNDCGKLEYRPYCCRCFGNYIIEKEALWDDYGSNKQTALDRIETVIAEAEKENCEITYKIEEYDR